MALIDLLPLVFLGLMLVKIKPAKPITNGINDEYLSVKTGKSLRGLLAIAIVLHHITNHIDPLNGGLTFRLFNNLGFLAVAVFFFISGYGLQKQYISNENYKKGFLLKRLPAVLFPYIIINLVYWVIGIASDKPYTVSDFFKVFINGEPVVAHSWYVLSILAFYIVFWLLMLICKKRYWLMFVGGTVYYVVYVLFCLKMNYGAWWYVSTHLLIVGMFWAIFEEKISAIVKKFYWVTALLIFGAYIGLSYAFGLVDLFGDNIILSVLFVLCVLLLLLKCNIGNPVLDFIGGISLELYLCHEIFLKLFKTQLVIQNDLLYAVVAIICSVVFAKLFCMLNKLILSGYKKLLVHKAATPKE